jgi:hypothetical protein
MLKWLRFVGMTRLDIWVKSSNVVSSAPSHPVKRIKTRGPGKGETGLLLREQPRCSTLGTSQGQVVAGRVKGIPVAGSTSV